jgi:hypothetical protein
MRAGKTTMAAILFCAWNAAEKSSEMFFWKRLRGARYLIIA